MVCPYCSTDMEPIELNGKVFCSNCGLTIKSGQPTEPVRQINQQPEKVEDITTDVPEEVQFPVVPEVAEVLETETMSAPDVILPNTDESSSVITPPSELTGVIEQFKPITQATEEELGLTPPEAIPEPELESKIPDIGIPSESDFENTEPQDQESPKSYLELANPGSDKDALDASGILLDILAEEPKEIKSVKEPRKLKVNILKDKPENPIEHPELESAIATTEKVKEAPEVVDPKTEKKIEKIEKQIEKMPEPIIETKPEEVASYDPDTVKSKAIKEYFSSALSEARNQPKKTEKITKSTTKNPKKKIKEHGPYVIFAITLGLVVAVLLGVIAYYLFTKFVVL